MTDDELRALWLDLGVSQREIKQMLKCSEFIMLKRILAMGLERRPRGTARQVFVDWEPIIADYEGGLSVAKVAQKHNVCRIALAKQMGIRGIVRRYGSTKRSLALPPTKPPPKAPDLAVETSRILATKGKWAALADFAKSHGITQSEAQRRYHTARAAV